MIKSIYHDLAASGRAVPIATDLMLHAYSDLEAVKLDGRRLGAVIEATALKYDTRLAFPLMDLTIEKSALLGVLKVPEAEQAGYHFENAPTEEQQRLIEGTLAQQPTPRMEAVCQAIRHIASSTTHVPVGMCIGPFSLMTKLIAEPITPVYLYGSGVTAAEDPEVARMVACLELAEKVIVSYIKRQIEARVRAIFVCEPAANVVYVSPNMVGGEQDVFETLVLEPNRRIQRMMEAAGVDLLLHDCGELTDSMVTRLASLKPAVLSLGSSRKLWEDCRLVSKDIVLFGNLPSKHFYSDTRVSVEEVERLSVDLIERMREADHPFILATECDVLNVPEHRQTLLKKVDAMVSTARAMQEMQTLLSGMPIYRVVRESRRQRAVRTAAPSKAAA